LSGCVVTPSAAPHWPQTASTPAETFSGTTRFAAPQDGQFRISLFTFGSLVSIDR